MASLSSYPSPSACTSSRSISSSTLLASPSFPFLKKPSRVSSRRISCKASNDKNNPSRDQEKTLSIDRRNTLLALGGLYGATNVLGSNQSTLASPIQPPDLSKCHVGDDLPKGVDINCCPPMSSKIVDFQLPSNPFPLRTRPAAHMADAAYIEKYKKALAAMKALPQDDPRSFYQQAKVHCAYCNGSYDQVGFPSSDLQVHHSWLFLPFHRWYLYFYERILGSLIDDPTFAIPFWNWDAPEGMPMPAMFNDPKSPLFDEKRDQDHLPPTIVDLNYEAKEKTKAKSDQYKNQIDTNLKIMYKQIVRPRTAMLFLGRPYRTGSSADESGEGSLETCPHNNIHSWAGDQTRQPNAEDMGHFYSAGRDPLFYAHHANVDRMWSIWKNVLKRRDWKSKDWLNAGFLFYDENAQLVRVNVRDSVSDKKLGYRYQEVDIPWTNSRPKPRKVNPWPSRLQSTEVTSRKLISEKNFPLTLNTTSNVLVRRPKRSRSKKEKEEEEEILVIEKIKYEPTFPLKFDVYINDEDEDPSAPNQTEFAGTFVNVPHSHKHKGKEDKRQTTRLSIPLNELLEDLDADNDENIVVTIVPRLGKGQISIGGVKIEYDKEEEA